MGVVYNTRGGGTGGTSMPLTINAAGTPAGRSFIAWVARETTDDAITFSVVDDKSNPYVATLNASGANGTRIVMWVVLNVAVGTKIVTFTASGSPVRFSGGVIECDPLNASYYDFLEVQENELIASSTSHFCGPEPGITTGANEIINVAIGQAAGVTSLGTITVPASPYSNAFIGATLGTTMASFRVGNTGSAERAGWSHTGSNRQLNNVLHSFLFATTTTPAYVAIPPTLGLFHVPRQPAIIIQNRVIQTGGAATAGLSVTMPLTQPVGGKSSFVVLIARDGSADRTYTVTDNGGGTWVQVFNHFGTGSSLRETQCSVCLNAPLTTTTVTVTASGSGAFSAVLLECDALHPTLYDDIRGTVNELSTMMNHQGAPNPGLITPNNVLFVLLGATGASLFTITATGFTRPPGPGSSVLLAYKLEPAGAVNEKGLWSQSGTARACINSLQALLFNTSAGAARTIVLPAIGSDYAENQLRCEDPTIINDTPSAPTTLTPPAIALALNTQAPTIAQSVTITLPVIAASFTSRAPLVQAGRNLGLPVITGTFTLRAPTIVIGRVLALPTLPLLFDAELPSLQAIIAVALSRIPTTLTPRAPTVIANTVIQLPAIMGAFQIKFPSLINNQMLTLPALPITLNPQAAHIAIFVEQLKLPAIALFLELPPLGKVDTGIEPPKFVGMHPLSLSLPMLVNVETSEGPTTTRLTNLSLQLPMLSGAEMN